MFWGDKKIIMVVRLRGMGRGYIAWGNIFAVVWGVAFFAVAWGVTPCYCDSPRWGSSVWVFLINW
jgi:hypothetical protein